MVKGIQHKGHNEEGCQSGHSWHHLDDQEEDQTLLTSQEVVTTVGVTCKYNDTSLYSHCNKGNNQSIKVPSTIQGFGEEPLKVIKTKVDVTI